MVSSNSHSVFRLAVSSARRFRVFHLPVFVLRRHWGLRSQGQQSPVVAAKPQPTSWQRGTIRLISSENPVVQLDKLVFVDGRLPNDDFKIISVNDLEYSTVVLRFERRHSRRPARLVVPGRPSQLNLAKGEYLTTVDGMGNQCRSVLAVVHTRKLLQLMCRDPITRTLRVNFSSSPATYFVLSFGLVRYPHVSGEVFVNNRRPSYQPMSKLIHQSVVPRWAWNQSRSGMYRRLGYIGWAIIVGIFFEIYGGAVDVLSWVASAMGYGSFALLSTW
jgi:hypothetical protein